MLDLLAGLPEPETLKNFLGEATQNDFVRTCSIFGLAAFVHAKQVRNEIKTQFGELVAVLKADLAAQQSVLAGLSERVSKLEAERALLKTLKETL